MKIVKLKGGLGNQMFQYAFAKLLEKTTSEIIKLDYFYFLSISSDLIRKPRIKRFNLTLPAAKKADVLSACMFNHTGSPLSFWYKVKIFLESNLNKNYVLETNRAYIPPATIEHKTYFDGYWQSWRYVDEVIEKLKEDFTPNSPLSEKTLITQEIMKMQNAVFVGVRRGDYSTKIKHFGIFDSMYYQNAMAKIDAQIENPVYYIFSNDIPWCKTNIDWGKHEIIYREPKDQTDDFEELMLMASCQHAIIVNSSYHWWGATMIENPNKIICCPKKWWFDDAPIEIIPDGWTRIGGK